MRLYELNYGNYNDICRDPEVRVKKISLFSPFIKGIEAAGLTHTGTVERKGIRKIYRRISNV